jgi:hypothetical protein
MDLSKIVARLPLSAASRALYATCISLQSGFLRFSQNFSRLFREHGSAPILSVSAIPARTGAVETTGIEPATSGLQSRRSPS